MNRAAHWLSNRLKAAVEWLPTLMLTVAGTPMTPSGTTGGNLQQYKNGFEDALYQRLVFIPTIEEGARPYGTGNHRKFQRVAGATLAQSADGTGLTYVSILGTPVTTTPVGSIVPIAWSWNEDAQTDVNFAGQGEQILSALSELTETAALANIASLTEGLSVADVEGPSFRRAQANLYGNTHGKAEPGKATMYGIFSHTQLPNLQAIDEYNNASVRGDSENPYVKGVMTKGQGVLVNTSTVVYNDGNGWHNAMYLGEAFTIDWNERSRVRQSEVEAQGRLIAFNNVASAVLNNDRAFYIRTTNNPL